MSEEEREQKKRKIEIQIKLDEKIASGIYVNMAMVNHTDAEFTIDLIHLQPQAPVATVRSRVITSPRHVRRLIKVLEDSLEKYERVHGQVEMPPPPAGEFRH